MKKQKIRWTPADDVAVGEYTRAGLTAAEVAQQIGRSRAAVERRRHLLGIAVNPPKWSKSEDKKLIRLLKAGLSGHEIGVQLGRSRVAVWHRIRGKKLRSTVGRGDA